MRAFGKEERRASLILIPALLVTGLLALGYAGTASAAVLCKTASNPCTGGIYGKGTSVEASLKSGTKSKLKVPVEIECEESTVKGEVTDPGPETVSGPISSFSFGKCSGFGEASIEVLKSGTFSIGSPSGGNGTLTLEGFEIKVTFAGVECIFGGPASTSLSGGEMGAIKVNASLPRGKGGPLCSEKAEWTAEYTVTAPEPLYVESGEAVVLCKTASEPCSGGTYGKSTSIEATLKAGTKSKLAGVATIECEEAAIEGEVTNPGPEVVSGSVSAISFGKCEGTVEVLKSGTFKITSPSGGSGILRLEGFEIKVTMAGVNCVYGGPTAMNLSGGEMASIKANALLAKKEGGLLCKRTAEWTAEYTVTAPEPLYVTNG
jgi:hypothetical protein